MAVVEAPAVMAVESEAAAARIPAISGKTTGAKVRGMDGVGAPGARSEISATVRAKG